MIIRGILDIKLYNGKRTDIAGGLHKEMGRKIRAQIRCRLWYNEKNIFQRDSALSKSADPVNG